MVYRLVYHNSQVKHNPNNKDVLLVYSIEDLEIAISYLLHLCYERIPVPKDRDLWVDTSFVFSNAIGELVVETAKFKCLEELEGN